MKFCTGCHFNVEESELCRGKGDCPYKQVDNDCMPQQTGGKPTQQTG